MKLSLLSLVLIILYTVIIEAQEPTYANVPGPENVLVVYNADSDTSILVKNYYRDSRNIPAVNIINPGLRFPDTTFTIDGVTHTVGLAQVTDNIRDFNNHNSHTWYATEHAWKYFYQYVAAPIKEWITSHNLTSTIRYIVLCKGVPFKVQAGGDLSHVNGNVTVDGLLSMLNTDN